MQPVAAPGNDAPLEAPTAPILPILAAESPGADTALDAEPETIKPTKHPKLSEQHYTIRYGDTGHSYQSILADYLQDATTVLVEDPYIRLPHQIQNFVRLCEVIVGFSTVRKIGLVTAYDDDTQRKDAEAKLQDLTQSLLDLDIVLEVAFNPNLHDREIRLDNGWVIKIGRGLDFYQRPSNWYEIGSSDLALRRCLETKVDIYHDPRG
jgi:ATP-dependent Lon protease